MALGDGYDNIWVFGFSVCNFGILRHKALGTFVSRFRDTGVGYFGRNSFDTGRQTGLHVWFN